MVDLEDRVAALETRVDALTVEVRHSTDVSMTARREALTAQEAHQRNIELLNALRATQAEHSRILDEHGRKLDEHGRKLDEHGRKLDEHTGRLDTIDGKLGQLMLGMHTVEALLRRALDE